MHWLSGPVVVWPSCCLAGRSVIAKPPVTGGAGNGRRSRAAAADHQPAVREGPLLREPERAGDLRHHALRNARPQRVGRGDAEARSEEHTSELQSLMSTSYAHVGLQKKNQQ